MEVRRRSRAWVHLELPPHFGIERNPQLTNFIVVHSGTLETLVHIALVRVSTSDFSPDSSTGSGASRPSKLYSLSDPQVTSTLIGVWLELDALLDYRVRSKPPPHLTHPLPLPHRTKPLSLPPRLLFTINTPPSTLSLPLRHRSPSDLPLQHRTNLRSPPVPLPPPLPPPPPLQVATPPPQPPPPPPPERPSPSSWGSGDHDAPEVLHLGWGHWYTLRELEAATNSFSDENVIGEGGYGIVYHGVLEDNT
ncbi:putative serine/threonine-protein kinase [Ananas comosus]|uniref:Putative serine/threonine-protein kinase n=1 Tax=Ananas comosus TaxID=4615 RepID=A0A199VF68_ANACO|nr:putative serine/threonine-protein kinase [Ananas comosus]